jgi:hypothetical protein
MKNETLESVAFESDSLLRRIREHGFMNENQRGTIVLLRSIEVLSDWCFFGCRSVETVTFESGSALQEIGAGAFRMSELKVIVIPTPARPSRIRISLFQAICTQEAPI